MMGEEESDPKRCKLDKEINNYSKYLFLVMVILGIIMITLKGYGKDWIVQFLRYKLLLCSIIPLSLKVNQDIGKFYFSYRIKHDKDIPGTVARNTSIGEDLGRIEYLLTDKTGTLTKNDMKMRKIVLGNEIKDVSKENFKSTFLRIYQKDLSIQISEESEDLILQRFLNCLIICHQVIPEINSAGEKVLDSSSPDEIAFIEFLQNLGFNLEKRTDNLIKFRVPGGKIYSIEILATFPFTSSRKRMGIVVKIEGKIVFYLKGADSIMMKILNNKYLSFVQDGTRNLSKEGLRTLVLAQKVISEEVFKKWLREYKNAQGSLKDREGKMESVLEQIEKDMDFLGVSRNLISRSQASKTYSKIISKKISNF